MEGQPRTPPGWDSALYKARTLSQKLCLARSYGLEVGSFLRKVRRTILVSSSNETFLCASHRAKCPRNVSAVNPHCKAESQAGLSPKAS